MKRRNFGLLAGTSMVALTAPKLKAFAQSAPSDFAKLSKTTLTPMGGERAGNAAGTIPAWTGGFTTIPAGWDPQTEQAPDFFASDPLLYTVNASNMTQYAHLLTDGVQTLIQKQGFSVQVYPTHRTAAAPQWVYDNVAQNVGRAKLNPAGGRLGFSGGFGGFPFPVPDATDPHAAGAQIMWNHTTAWNGTYNAIAASAWVVASGVPVRSDKIVVSFYYPYYDQQYNVDNFGPYVYYQNVSSSYPLNIAGEILVIHESLNAETNPSITWQLQLGLGRVRKAPEITHDTPASYTNGISNYDEFTGFLGSLDEYDWQLIGKQEMLIPYNNNKMGQVTLTETLGPKFPNPNVIRWELHRVWVVEATLHPGERNVLARRRFYVDEDTWHVRLTDAWDGKGDIYHHTEVYDFVCPQLPGTICANSTTFNLQTGDYVITGGPSADPPGNKPISFAPISISNFQPQTMAANATY